MYGLKGRSKLSLVDTGQVATRGQHLQMRLRNGKAEVLNLDTKTVVPASSDGRQAVIDGMLGTGGGSGELAGPTPSSPRTDDRHRGLADPGRADATSRHTTA